MAAMSAAPAGEPRAEGPALVTVGPDQAATVLVLDPAGEARHRRLPATWRPLARHVGVRWYRLPAADRLRRPLPEPTGRCHLVAGGSAAAAALDLADDHPDAVESVLLVGPTEVDPDTDPGLDPDIGEPARYPVTVIRGDGDHPTPLGHPGVVEQVVRTLVETGAAVAGPVPERTRTPGFLSDAWTALVTLVGAVLP